MIRQIIRQLVEDSFKELKIASASSSDLKIYIEKPPKEEFGDYAVKVCYAKEKLKDSLTGKATGDIIGNFSREEYEKLTSKIKENVKFGQYFEKIEFKMPVFINFFLSKKYIQEQVAGILESGGKFGELKIGENKKIQVEFISANPTGPLTIANARGGTFGDTLGNILEKAGFKVSKSYYINDCGQQILALGHSVLKDEEAQYRGGYIDYLNKQNKEKDPYKAGEKAAEIIINEMIIKTTEKMGIKYDEWIRESSLYKSKAVDKAIKLLEKKGETYSKDGALWLRASKYGDERDRVIIKKDGIKTYLTGDIALHQYYFNEKKADKVIQVWGADHHGDVPGLLAAMEILGHKDKLRVILFQFVTLVEEGRKIRMSKRKGIYVTMDELLEKVDKDVARFFFMQKSFNTHLAFDLSLAQEQSEKNPVYYIQYAYARICSILKKSGIRTLESKETFENLKLLNHSSELALIKKLVNISEVVEDTARDYQVQRLPRYAIELATAFHKFYCDCKVLTENEDLTKARLKLIAATKIVLKNTLDLMGVSAPEKM